MGEHRANPVAIANNVPRQQVNVVKLGESGFGLLGLQLVPQKHGDDFVVVLAAIGGRMSDLVPLIPRPVVIGEIARLTEANLVALFEATERPQEEPTNADPG